MLYVEETGCLPLPVLMTNWWVMKRWCLLALFQAVESSFVVSPLMQYSFLHAVLLSVVCVFYLFNHSKTVDSLIALTDCHIAVWFMCMHNG